MNEKAGVVTSINPAKCTARVMFEDSDDVVSDELQLVVRGSLKNKDYWMPKVGEHVLCTFTKQKKGFILGAVYSEKSPPPVTNEGKRHVKFEDGTAIEYDSKTHTLLIQCIGPVNIQATGNVNVTGDVISDGISLKNHIHTGVNGLTSPPNGGA